MRRRPIGQTGDKRLLLTSHQTASEQARYAPGLWSGATLEIERGLLNARQALRRRLEGSLWNFRDHMIIGAHGLFHKGFGAFLDLGRHVLTLKFRCKFRWLGHVEQASSHSTGRQLDEGVRNEVPNFAEISRGGDAEGDRGIQGAAGDAADGDASHGHAQPDGEPEVLRQRRLHGRDGQHDEGEDGGPDELGDENLAPVGAGGLQGIERVAGEQAIGAGSEEAGGKLDDHVLGPLLRRALAPAGGDDCHGHSRVEVCTGHSAQGEDHAHQAGGDRERARDRLREHVQAYSEHEHVRAEELAQQLR
mmetsp:Transcript_103508/g.278115  ORF Transcript_103508/g.278115 Transcript_103508/m.278115 type:complete len:305 (-) Transcript_103508:81-995(-)